MRRAVVIGLAILIPVGVVGIALAGRLMTPAAGSAAPQARGVIAAAPGQGVKIKFSDKPVTVPMVKLTSLDGQPVSSEAWKGKVVLVNFWATWCGPCRAEIPSLIALQDRYRDYLVIVGLSTDTKPVDEVQAFVKQAGLNYPVAIAGPAVEAAFGGVPALPSTFVVTPQGGIVQRHVGQLDPVVTEHEIRVLAGLPTDATVETVKDVGQVLLANAAYATEIPGVDLKALTPRQKEDALRRLNTENCTCGCGLTLAQCRINDPTCTVSLPAAKKLVDAIARGR
jgi:thiol-disulfide isomerase/thioredoxin